MCRSQKFVLQKSCLQTRNDKIVEGLIMCGECTVTFPIRDGIPRFVLNEEYAGSFGLQWNKFRKTQLDSHTGLPLSSNRLFKVTQWQENLDGQMILEAGSGAGRFTEVLLGTGATVFSFDLSNAVEANLANNGHLSNLNLFQASIYRIPLPEKTFDKVICLGVLQHTPDPERSFRSLVRFLKPGGQIAVDIYARRARSLVSWKYVLRPLTITMRKDRLFLWVSRVVDALLPLAILLRRLGGRVGARLLPIVEYSHLGLSPSVNREWAILDSFDMYSPAHDHPRSIAEVRRWFEDAGLEESIIQYGPNGVVARGRRPRSVSDSISGRVDLGIAE
jgi:SAM-dependent methyltransferase